VKIRKINAILVIIFIITAFTLNAQFNDFNSSEMLYHVSLVGAVNNPGVYIVAPSTRVSEVLKMESSQILLEEETDEETKNIALTEQVNSMRNIVIKRKNTVLLVDLEKYNIVGDLQNNPFLQDGDVILVHPKLGDVEITGAVKREGVYEFKRGDKIADIIEFALGLDYYADCCKTEVFRHIPDKKNERISVNVKEALSNAESPENIELEVGDRIYIRHIPEFDDKSQILIQGEVLYPGYYSIEGGSTTLLEILGMCGGPTSKADLQNSFLQRLSKEDNKDIEFERLKLMLVEDMTELEYQYFKTKSREMRGKFSTDFDNLWKSKESLIDVLLKGNDYIYIPRKSFVVQVSGQVKNPGLIVYVPGKDYTYYIEKAGGFSWNARKRKVQLIKANTGERLHPSEEDILEIQDMIFVPEKRDLDYWKITKDVFLVFSQIATTVLIIQNVTK